MESSEMLFETNRGVAYLTVNRPEQRNAMTWAMYQRLVETCEQVDRDDAIKVLVIRGSGERAFISGTDIGQFPAFRGNPQAGIEYEERIDRVVGRLEAVAKPTLASIRGFCIGGGLGIAMACDLRIAAEDARFGVPTIRLGNCLSMHNYTRLVTLIGPAPDSRRREGGWPSRPLLGHLLLPVSPDAFADRGPPWRTLQSRIGSRRGRSPS